MDKVRHKHWCSHGALFPLTEATPKIAPCYWRGNYSTATHPVDYPATSVLWKCDINTGGTIWELNVGRNTTPASNDQSQSITRQRYPAESWIKRPWGAGTGGKPLHKIDDMLYFGQSWGSSFAEMSATNTWNFVRTTDQGTTHGEIEFLSGSYGVVNDNNIWHGTELVSGGLTGSDELLRIDLDTFAVSSYSASMTNGWGHDGTSLVACRTSTATHAPLATLTGWTTVKVLNSTTVNLATLQSEPPRAGSVLAVTHQLPTHFSIPTDDRGTLSLIDVASGQVTATASADIPALRVFRNGDLLFAFCRIGLGTVRLRVYDSSLTLLDDILAADFYADFHPTSNTNVFTELSFISPRSPNFHPLGDGDSWIFSTPDGIHRISYTDGIQWTYPASQPGVVSVTGNTVLVTGQLGQSVALALDLESGELLWQRLYPYRPHYLPSNTLTYVQHLVDGDSVFILTPNNCPVVRYG